MTEADEVAAERKQRLDAIAAKLSRDDIRILTEELGQLSAATSTSINHMIERTIAFCFLPAPCAVKIMGVAYALDLGMTMGLSISAQARQMGVTRASISNAAWQYCRTVGLQPSRWMRSEATTKANRQARVRYVTNSNT